MPLPGTGGAMGQAYTLADGSRRILTEDPKASQSYDPVAAAARTGDDVLPVSTPAATPASGDRAAVSSAIASATATRGAGSAPVHAASEAPSASAEGEAGEGAPEDGAEVKSNIVAEEFVLPNVVATLPGRTEIMPVATGHLNRLETPFTRPMVRTSAQADAVNIQFDQNFVYVSVTAPVTLFIHDEGHPDPAIVLSLVPQRIAPRQVKVTVPPTTLKVIEANAKKVSEAAKPAAVKGPAPNSKGITRTTPGAAVTNTLASAIESFAHGKMPPGYQPAGFGTLTADMFCAGGGVSYSFRQGAVITSQNYYIVRGMAEAKSKVSLQETWCAQNPDTLAVAFAPRTEISPDHPADFYVLVRRPSAPIKTAR